MHNHTGPHSMSAMFPQATSQALQAEAFAAAGMHSLGGMDRELVSRLQLLLSGHFDS